MTRKQGDQKQAAGGADASDGQAAVTAPRPVDAQGRELDHWGLPINGPARLRALAQLAKPDPNEDPSAWSGDVPLQAPVIMESENG